MVDECSSDKSMTVKRCLREGRVARIGDGYGGSVPAISSLRCGYPWVVVSPENFRVKENGMVMRCIL